MPPAVPADSSLEDISSAADTVASSHVLGSAVQQNESLVKLWTRTSEEAAAAAVSSPYSLAYVPTLGALSSVPLLNPIVQRDEALVNLWAQTPEEAATAAVLSPHSVAYVPTLGALSSLSLLHLIMQPADDSIAEQPLQGPDSPIEQAGSDVDSTGTAPLRQRGIKVCTIAQYGGQVGCSNLGSNHAL